MKAVPTAPTPAAMEANSAGNTRGRGWGRGKGRDRGRGRGGRGPRGGRGRGGRENTRGRGGRVEKSGKKERPYKLDENQCAKCRKFGHWKNECRGKRATDEAEADYIIEEIEDSSVYLNF